MKTFPSSQFVSQLDLSRHASYVISEFAEIDKLVKFALQHCETISDYNNLLLEVQHFNTRFVQFIKRNICYESTENLSSSSSTPSDN